MSTLLKMGVVGLGRMGQLYARLLATQVSGVQLHAVAEVDGQTKARLIDEFAVPHAFADGHEMMALPELDAVVIATPTSTHYHLVLAAAALAACEIGIAATRAYQTGRPVPLSELRIFS